MKDILIPIVFPEYKIAVVTPKADVDLLPWFEFDNFTIAKSKQKLSNLGHAGILIINGKSGVTKYYEYGRYDPALLGLVRRVPLPNSKVDSKGIVLKSLIPVLRKISNVAGNGTRIEGVFLEASGVFDKVNQRALVKKSSNKNPNRPKYELMSNNCIHFVKSLVETAGKDTPWMIDPRPNSYIGEFRGDYRDLDYSPRTNKLIIENVGDFSL